MEGRAARFRQEMGTRELTQTDLDIMDRDGDGIVTRAEFLEFMLVAMNKIDEDLVQELNPCVSSLQGLILQSCNRLIGKVLHYKEQTHGRITT